MFSMGMLAALSALAGFAGYQYSKAKQKSPNTNLSTNTAKVPAAEDSSVAKNVNTYNYYTSESENGNTLFGSQKKRKRTLFDA